jgi:hypothetical protein
MSRELLKMAGVFWDDDLMSSEAEIGGSAAAGGLMGAITGTGSTPPLRESFDAGRYRVTVHTPRSRGWREKAVRGVAGAAIGAAGGAGVGSLFRHIRHDQGLDDNGWVANTVGVSSPQAVFDSAVLGAAGGLAARYA